jgi:preprotein translocase subunit SecG
MTKYLIVIVSAPIVFWAVVVFVLIKKEKKDGR